MTLGGADNLGTANDGPDAEPLATAVDSWSVEVRKYPRIPT